MSPEFHFVLVLALRMAVTAAFVVAASMITERVGPVLGALVATLPVSGGPSYIFLAMDHGADFVAQAAVSSLPVNAVTLVISLVYAVIAQRANMPTSLAAILGAWLAGVLIVRQVDWTIFRGIVLNLVVLAACLPFAHRYTHAKMPLIVRRWYDVPLRAAVVSTLVATVVTASYYVSPQVSGIIALFPGVYTSFVLILHPRIGGPATAAVFANGMWGLIGFGLGVLTLCIAPPLVGAPAGLSLALAACITWNIGLWAYGRARMRATSPPSA
jgi:hypothetical protein